MRTTALLLFLCLAADLGAGRLGGKFVSLTHDLPGIYANPAQMMDLKSFRAVFEYESFRDISSYYQFTLGLYKRFDILALGLSVESAGTDLAFREVYINSYNNSVYRVSAGLFPLRGLSLAALFSIPTITTFNYSFKSIDISLGGIYNTGFLNVGLLLENLYKNGEYNRNGTGIAAGASYLLPFRSFYVRLFSDLAYKEGFFAGAGAEAVLPLAEKTLLSLSGGYEKNFGFGLGLKFFYFQVNYGMNLMDELGVKNTISINANF